MKRVEFWSSAEYDTFMEGLMRSLGGLGLDALQLFEVSTEAYRTRRGTLGKVMMRLRMYAIYPLRLFFHCKESSNVCWRVVSTNTFYAPLAASLAQNNKSSKVIHLIYDLFPDALFASGIISEGSFLARACDSIVQKTMRSVDANVFLAKRLLKHAEARFGKIPNACIIPIGADGSAFSGFPPKLSPHERPVDILYCGNLGRLHDIETLLFTLNGGLSLDGRGLAFSFHASGHGVKLLEMFKQSCPANITFLLGGFLSRPSWVSRMKTAEVALVTMRFGAEKVLMPSKTYSALVAGQAILAICPRESDLADLVLQHDCGWVVEPGDTSSLRVVLRDIQANGDALQCKRENAFRAGHSIYSTAAVALQWKDLFDSLQND